MFAFVLGEDSFTALLPMIARGTLRFAYAMPGGATGAVTAVDLDVSGIVDGKQVVDSKSSDAWGVASQLCRRQRADEGREARRRPTSGFRDRLGWRLSALSVKCTECA